MKLAEGETAKGGTVCNLGEENVIDDAEGLVRTCGGEGKEADFFEDFGGYRGEMV